MINLMKTKPIALVCPDIPDGSPLVPTTEKERRVNARIDAAAHTARTVRDVLQIVAGLALLGSVAVGLGLVVHYWALLVIPLAVLFCAWSLSRK